MSKAKKIEFLLFDVESIADGNLIAAVKYPGEGLEPAAAVARFQEELRETQNGRDFIPHTFQIPIAVVVAKVDSDLNMVDLVSLDEPEFRSHVMTQQFWRGWEHYQHPTWVTFNGRGFDLPVMELAAFRYGLTLKDWFYSKGASYTHPRNRYNASTHLDLHEWLTNYGACWFRGGLDLAATLLGKPGKMSTKGHQVQEMWNAGELQDISDYCRCDVLDTYFVFLRTCVVSGKITLEREAELVDAAHKWLIERADGCKAYVDYLSCWGDWKNPFQESPDIATEAVAIESPELAIEITADKDTADKDSELDDKANREAAEASDAADATAGGASIS